MLFVGVCIFVLVLFVFCCVFSMFFVSHVFVFVHVLFFSFSFFGVRFRVGFVFLVAVAVFR